MTGQPRVFNKKWVLKFRLGTQVSPPHPRVQNWKFNSRGPHYSKRIIYFKNDWHWKNKKIKQMADKLRK